MNRRRFLLTAGATGLAGLGARQLPAGGSVKPRLRGADAPFDHVVVLMMENRSWDHFLGWLPGADGQQAGLSYTDTQGRARRTYDLAPDFQGCGASDPNHSWSGGAIHLNRGKADGFLKTANPGDTLPIGYYTEKSVPVLGALARNYTTSDNYFGSILAETYPNRFYQHCARTDRDHNTMDECKLTTIWDRLAGAGLTGTLYHQDLPFLALWRQRYLKIIKPFDRFLLDAASGSLPNVSFVDPAFAGEDQGASRDDHPHADVRSGESFISTVYEAVRHSPQWDRTVMVINYDEWGGFFDHVAPPRVVDDTPRKPGGPDWMQLGFRVPNVVISPYARSGRIVRGGAPFEHTSVLKMIEWRWGLKPLTARDAHARNLADYLDFSSKPRRDVPAVPKPHITDEVLFAKPCLPPDYPSVPAVPKLKAR